MPMPRQSFLHLVALLTIASSAFAPSAFAKDKPEPDHWVGTWATADVDEGNPNAVFGAEDTTFRQIVHVSLGGALIRVELSNEFGVVPLVIGEAHIALAGKNGDIELTSANSLTFGGKPGVIIPAGAHIVSDPAGIKLPPFADLAISLFVPAQKIPHRTMHNSAYQTSWSAPGNVVGSKSLTGAKKQTSWFFLKAVDVMAPASTGAVVAFGDSITDGTASSTDKNSRWPDVLARRLQVDKAAPALGVLNEGIGGNRVLHDNTGPSALARFDRDVLSLSGVKYMIVLESINDIGHSFDPAKPYDVITADDLIAGFKQMIERAHMHGIQVFGATATPYVGAKYASPAGEACRQAVNQWIRTGNAFDGVIDFDKATADPGNTTAFLPAYDHGDHLHPNDAGMKAMGEAIDLKLFTLTKK